MDQQCLNCGNLFNYYDRVATVVCDRNHVVCKICANALRQINARCPNCRDPIIGTERYLQNMGRNKNTYNNQSYEAYNNQNYNPQPYWQNSYNQNQTFNQNQGYYQNPIINQNPIGNQGPIGNVNGYRVNNQGFQPIINRNRKNGAIFCALSAIFAIIFIILLVFRLSVDAFSPEVPPLMFGLFICAFIFLVFFFKFLAVRRQNQAMQMAGNYIRA